MKLLLVPAFAFTLLLAACTGGASDIAVVNKVLKKEANTSTAGGPDLGMSIPSSGALYWVEGNVKNNGKEEAKNVTLAFRVTDGNTTTVLTAEIRSVPSGKTAGFRTPPQMSHTTLRLIEEDPDIRIGR